MRGLTIKRNRSNDTTASVSKIVMVLYHIVNAANKHVFLFSSSVLPKTHFWAASPTVRNGILKITIKRLASAKEVKNIVPCFFHVFFKMVTVITTMLRTSPAINSIVNTAASTGAFTSPVNV